MVTIKFDFNEWMRYSDIITEIRKQLPIVQKNFLRSVAARYRSVIMNTLLSQNIKYTGTYEQSVKIIDDGSSDEPQIALVLDPTGSEAARLPIYWLVLEFGGAPNPNIPVSRIRDWAGVKFGKPYIGSRIARSIRTRGINPHPILSSIFLLTPPSGDVIGLTVEAQQIFIEEGTRALQILENVFFTTSKTGQVVARIPAGVPEGGRFTSPG